MTATATKDTFGIGAIELSVAFRAPLLLDDLVHYDEIFPDGVVNDNKNKPVGIKIISNKE